MTEDHIEQFALARLRELGYAYQHGPGMAHDGEHYQWRERPRSCP